IAIDVEERRDRGLPLVRLAAQIEPEWLLDKATERITLEWNRAAERVEQVAALVYDQLVIEETRGPAPADEETARFLAAKAREVDIGRLVDRAALEQWRAGAASAETEIGAEAVLTALCEGRISFAELASADLLEVLLPPRLHQLAPERLTLPGGRQV